MQKTIRGVKLPPVTRGILHNGTPFPRISITLLLVVSFLAAVVVVNTLAKHLGEADATEPFAAFADRLPGHQLDTSILKAEGFTCSFDLAPLPYYVSEECWQQFQTGLFSLVHMTVWDGTVKRLDLLIRGDWLTVGELALLWGRPDVYKNGNYLNVSWSDPHVMGTVLPRNGRFTFFLALSQISIYCELNQPCPVSLITSKAS